TPNTVIKNEGASGVIAGGGKEVPENSSATNNNDGSDIVTPPPPPIGGEPPSPPPSDEPSYVPVSVISVTPKALTLIVGETGKITATVSPSNATNKKVIWSSDNKEVANVDASGNVT